MLSPCPKSKKSNKDRIFVSALIYLVLCISTEAMASSGGAEESTKICQEFLSAGPQKDLEISPDIAKAAKSFTAYFDAIKGRLFERNDLVDLVSIALLAKEHVLIMGPPGNAKSLLADEILGNITDAAGKSSYYRIQMTPETTMSETHGPINPKEILESGKIDRQYSEGILAKRNAFIDEIFDGRANALRNILGVLAERQHAQGGHIEPGKTETVIAATNKYIDAVYEKAGDDSPRAVLDRFAFNVYVPGEFKLAASYEDLIESDTSITKMFPPLTFNDLDVLRALLSQVKIPRSVSKMLATLSFRMKSEAESMEAAAIKDHKKKLKNGFNDVMPPYRSTKYHSPRTLHKAASMLKAIVVYEYAISSGKRALRANFDDLKKLRTFFTLNGPDSAFVEDLLDRASSPYERSQLSAILTEREMFDTIYEELYGEVSSKLYMRALSGTIPQGFSGLESGTYSDKEEIYDSIAKGLTEITLQLDINAIDGRQAQIDPEMIALSAIYEGLDETLEHHFPGLYNETHNKIKSATQATLANLKETIETLRGQHTALLEKLEAYTSKRSKLLADRAKKITIKNVDLHIKLRYMYETNVDPQPISLIQDIKNDSAMLLDKSDAYLLKPNGRTYFKDWPEDGITSHIRGSHYAFIDIDGNLVLFNHNYKHSYDNTGKYQSHKSIKISKSKPLVALGHKKLIVVDFGKSKVNIIDTYRGDKSHIKLSGFRIYNGDGTIHTTSNQFDELLQTISSSHETFVTKRKLITIYPQLKSAFIVDLKTGDSQYIENFKNKMDKLVSVDRDGNIYGVSFKDKHSRKSLEVFTFSPDSTPNEATAKITLNIDSDAFNSKNRFFDATVDSSGLLIVTAERPYLNNKQEGISKNRYASGFYMYNIKTGDILSQSPIFKAKNLPIFTRDNERWPEKIISYGPGRLLFVTSRDGDSRAPYYIYSAKFDFNGTNHAIDETTQRIQVTKKELNEVEHKLSALNVAFKD